MGLNQLTDEQLMAEFQTTRNNDAFTELYNRNYKNINSFVSKTLKLSNISEDVTQDVFVKLFNKPEKYDASRPFKPWLFQSAKYQSIDTVRQLERQRAENGYEFDMLADEEHEFVDIEPLKHHLKRIPADIQECLRLRFYEKMKYHHIAEKQKIPLGTVKSRIHAGIEKLRSFIE